MSNPKTNEDGSGNENGNPNHTGGPADMPEYARLMFKIFMKAYTQVQEQIASINNRQGENGERHSDVREWLRQ